MNKIILCFVALLLSNSVQSQYTYFNNVFEGNITGTLQAKLFDEGTNYISLGLEDFGMSRRSYSISGGLISFDASSPTLGEVGAGINIRDNFLETPEGFITSYGFILNNCPSSTYYSGIAQYNNSLDTIWTRTFPQWSICDTLGTGTQCFSRINSETSAMLSLMVYYNGHPAPVDSFAIRITTFENLNGNIISDHFTTRPYQRFQMTQMRYIDGFFYILGDAIFEQTNPLDYQTLLVKVNANAEIVGELEFGNPNGGWEKVPQMEIDNDGNIVLVHEYCTNWESVNLNDWKQMSQMYYTRIDPDEFVVLGDIPFAMPGLDDWIRGVQNTCVRQDAQNNYLVVSGVGEANYDIPDLVCVITKLNEAGEIIWQNIYLPPDFSDPDWNEGGMFDLIQTSDGGYLVSGVSYTLFQKHWLLKLDNCGYEVPSDCPAVVGVEEQNETIIQLWPNPFHNLLKAVLPQDAQRVFITDMTGRKLFEERVYFPNQQFDLSLLAKGVYLFNAECEDGRVVGQRVVKN